MIFSSIEPKVIEIDKIKNGAADILVHWDIEQIEHEGEIMWQYEECVMRGNNAWILPCSFCTCEDVEVYLMENQVEIVNWAKGSKVNVC